MQIQLMMEIVQFLTIFGAPSANLNYLRLVHPHQHINLPKEVWSIRHQA